METEYRLATSPVQTGSDSRRYPRFKIQFDVDINSRTCGKLKGRSVDLSESGIAAMLLIEVPLGEVVELKFTLPSGPVTIYASARQRNAFRYGFGFVDTVPEVIRRTCQELAVEQPLIKNA
jgi:hypothetical protein